MFNFLANTVIGKLFDAMRERLMKTQRGRWILGALFLLLSAVCAAYALLGKNSLITGNPSSQDITFAIGSVFFLALALLVLFGNILIGGRLRQVERIKRDAEARTKQLLAEGKLLPIPPLPKNAPPGASADDLARVEQYAAQLAEIPWGDQVEYPDGQALVIFESTMAYVRTVSGDWARLREPIRVFTALPRPYCHIGAAEVMLRLSYLQGMTFAPVGLRQGVRFTTRAQLHTPLQPDALVVQLRLLAACRVSYWQDLATKTLALIQQVAPEHPYLPHAEMFYHQMRGEYDQALIDADRALANTTSPEETASLLSSKASLQMSLKRYDDAVAAYQQALTLNSNDPWIWHNLSIALTQQERYSEALQASELALSIMDFGVARKQRELLLQKLSPQAQSGA